MSPERTLVELLMLHVKAKWTNPLWHSSPEYQYSPTEPHRNRLQAAGKSYITSVIFGVTEGHSQQSIWEDAMNSLFLCVGVLLAFVGCYSNNTQAAAPRPAPAA